MSSRNFILLLMKLLQQRKNVLDFLNFLTTEMAVFEIITRRAETLWPCTVNTMVADGLATQTSHGVDVHCTDVIMTTMASQITSLTVVYWTVYSDADEIKHQSSASVAFVWGLHRDRWIPRTKGQLRGKCFHLMTSSWLSGLFPLQHHKG